MATSASKHMKCYQMQCCNIVKQECSRTFVRANSLHHAKTRQIVACTRAESTNKDYSGWKREVEAKTLCIFGAAEYKQFF